jgi:hypothetical protein
MQVWYNSTIKRKGHMGTKSKKLLANAREDKARRIRLELDRLTGELEEAEGEDARDLATLALNAYYDEQSEDEERKGQLVAARLKHREAKKAGRSASGKRKITWAEGGRELVPGRARGGKEFFAAAEGNLVKCSRDITRWETSDPYDNMRGVRKGEIIMVLTEHYTGNNDKDVVDIMVGPDIVKGVPAAALRPLDG